MKIALACLLLAVPLAAGAQTYKCKDREGKVTYSNETCAKQGLRDGGEVRDRLTTMPSAPPEGRPVARKDAEKKTPSRTDDWNSGASEPGRSRP